MKLKLTNLFLVLCLILFSINIWADPPAKTEKSSTTDADKDKNKQLPDANQITTEPFFKDATYEKFEPRDGSEPFSSSYLEGK